MTALRIIGLYVWNVLIAVDQLGNALLAGDPDETISSRAYKNRDRAVWRALGWMLERIDRGHLRAAHEPDEGRAGVARRYFGER